MTDKIQIICGTCGSAAVLRDAWAEWDADKQDWVLSSVFDDGHCEVCEGESQLDEMPLDQWKASEFETEIVCGFEISAKRGDEGWYGVVTDADAGMIWHGVDGCPNGFDAKNTARHWVIHSRRSR